MVLFVLYVHESWHEFGDIDLLELSSLQLEYGCFGAFIQEYGRVLKHSLIPLDFILDLCNFLKGLLVLLLVDVVNNDSVISFDDLSVFDAFINFAVALQHLEDRLSIFSVLCLLKEL